MTGCERSADAGAFVLQALEPAEADAYRGHLEACPDCRAAVAELGVVADALPMAAPQLAAPPDLKGRIMAVVEAEAELLNAAGPELDTPRTVDRRWGVRRWFRRPMAVAAVACSMLAAGIVAGVVLEGAEDGGDRVRTVAAQAPGGARVALHVHENGHGELVMRDMPSAPVGRVYQVWTHREGHRPRPTHTLFTVPQDGRARVAIDVPVRGADQVLVTAEPAGGSEQPTRDPVVVAKLS